MKKNYIAPYCLFEVVEEDHMIMSSVFDDNVTNAAGDNNNNYEGPGTTPGGANPDPTPGGPIEIDSKFGGGFFWGDDE